MKKMKKLTSNKDGNTIIMLVAESLSDWECLDTLYNDGIVFGAFLLYNLKDNKQDTPLAKWLIKNFPTCYGILQISVVKNFANKVEDKLPLQGAG